VILCSESIFADEGWKLLAVWWARLECRDHCYARKDGVVGRTRLWAAYADDVERSRLVAGFVREARNTSLPIRC
jgi:hypothetical protein